MRCDMAKAVRKQPPTGPADVHGTFSNGERVEAAQPEGGVACAATAWACWPRTRGDDDGDILIVIYEGAPLTYVTSDLGM